MRAPRLGAIALLAAALVGQNGGATAASQPDSAVHQPAAPTPEPSREALPLIAIPSSTPPTAAPHAEIPDTFTLATRSHDARLLLTPPASNLLSMDVDLSVVLSPGLIPPPPGPTATISPPAPPGTARPPPKPIQPPSSPATQPPATEAPVVDQESRNGPPSNPLTSMPTATAAPTETASPFPASERPAVAPNSATLRTTPRTTPGVDSPGADGDGTQKRPDTAAPSPSTSTSDSQLSSSTVKPTTVAPVVYVRERFTRLSRNDSQSSKNKDLSPQIIGGLDEQHTMDDGSQADNASTRGAPVAQVYHVLQYVVSICAAVSMVLLVSFQDIAVDERFNWFDVAWGPTTWEFVVYVSYVQHLASISQLVLIKTPASLWEVLDGLSWTCLIPYHSNDSAVSLPEATKAAASTTSRRLDNILLSGMVAFADRVGIQETDLLVRTVTGLALFACIFLVLFFVFAALAKRRMDYYENHPSRRGDTKEVARAMWLRNLPMRVCTLLVLLWFFALYPLSSVSTYEVAMEVRANSLAPAQLLLVGIAMLVVCLGGLLLIGYIVSSRSRAELSEPFQLAAWGSLYADYMYNKRSFLVVPVLLQIVTGVVVGAGSEGSVQLALLLAILVVYLLALWVVHPFQQGCVAPWFVVAVTLLKIVNLGIAVTSFTIRSELPSGTRASAGDGIVYLNSLVVICWLFRHCVVFVQTLRTVNADELASDAQNQTTGRRNTVPFSSPSFNDTDTHAGGFLVLDSQRSGYQSVRGGHDSQGSRSGFFDTRKSESYRGMTSSLRAWKRRHLAVA